MVEEHVDDGKRIAQLLASELTGLERGPLDAVTVVEADSSAEPSPTGTVAYRIAYRDKQVATVEMYPAYAEIRMAFESREADSGGAERAGANGRVVRIDTGAGVKAAVDDLCEALERYSTDE